MVAAKKPAKATKGIASRSKAKGKAPARKARPKRDYEVVAREEALELTGLDSDDLREAGIYSDFEIRLYRESVATKSRFTIEERTGVIILGDLSSQLDIVQEDFSGLIVRGGLRARHFITLSGAYILGKIEIIGVLYACSLCDHRLSARQIKARAVIDDGHTLDLRRRDIKGLLIEAMHHPGSCADPDVSADALPTILVPEVLKASARLDGARLVKRLHLDLPVLLR